MSNEGFFASGNCLVKYYYYGTDATGTATFSATSTGVTYIETVDTLKNVLSTLVNNFFIANPSYKEISVMYYDITCMPDTNPKLTLYYNLIINDENVVNQELFRFDTTPVRLTGASNQHMTNSLYEPNSDILSFFAYRTPLNSTLDLLPIYNETVSILQPNNGSYVSAQKTYIDYGAGFASTVPFTLFDITCASGIFSNFSLMKIVYDNSDKNMYKRKVEFY